LGSGTAETKDANEFWRCHRFYEATGFGTCGEGVGAVRFGHLGADAVDAVGDVGPLGELADAVVAALA
jgi:hypothetical protein